MKIIELNNIINPENENYKTCLLCGHTGPEVVNRPSYLGGSGLTSSSECSDRVNCLYRWDKKAAGKL